MALKNGFYFHSNEQRVLDRDAVEENATQTAWHRSTTIPKRFYRPVAATGARGVRLGAPRTYTASKPQPK